MKITQIHTKEIQLELINTFTTAALARDFQPSILIKIETDQNLFGIGEIIPTRHVTGETIQSALTFINEIRPQLLNQDPLDIAKIHNIMDRHAIYNSAAKAGIDIALHDLLGKAKQQPLYKLLGGSNKQVQTDITIPIQTPENMARVAECEYEKGFRVLKIKIGLNPQEDLKCIELIRKSLGDKVSIKADANQGYSIPDAISIFNTLLQYNVDGIEQPRPFWDIFGTKEVKDATEMKVIADESIHTHFDAMNFIQANACDMMNIKLMKSSGFYKAEKINALCEQANIPCMIGCMVESRIGITAGAHFVAAKDNIIEADLDGFLLTKELPFVKGGFNVQQDVLTLSDKPGLGIEIDW